MLLLFYYICYFVQVCFVGQPIGAILAEDRTIAKRAASLVKVEYEDLDAILTIEVTGAIKVPF